MDIKPIDWNALRIEFPEDDLEWLPKGSGMKQDGTPWLRLVPYIQARAIQDRLDMVVGPANWFATYKDATIGGVSGLICHLSIRISNQEWLTKFDGAEPPENEPFKGNITNAFKRAAVQWGIGRYLYDVEPAFAQIVAVGTKGARLYSDKVNNKKFMYLPPKLTSLQPMGKMPEHTPGPSVVKNAPVPNVGMTSKMAVSPASHLSLGQPIKDFDSEALN